MDFRYDDAGDASQQLDGCVMRTKDDVVGLIYEGEWQYSIRSLENGKCRSDDVRKLGLSFEPLELGYVNSPYSLVYIVRNPIRMWKAGITWDNVKALRGDFPENLFKHLSLKECMLNIYPSMQEAWDRAKGDGDSVAFHSDFAFIASNYPNIELEYKGVVIGSVNDDSFNLEVDDKYAYLKEILEEIING